MPTRHPERAKSIAELVLKGASWNTWNGKRKSISRSRISDGAEADQVARHRTTLPMGGTASSGACRRSNNREEPFASSGSAPTKAHPLRDGGKWVGLDRLIAERLK